MELLVFGHGGARVIVFPTSMGRFYDWENRGMIAALKEHLERSWIQLFCLDSVDAESWYCKSVHPAARAQRHVQYEEYILNEVLPFSHAENQNPFLISVGASFGAYHAVNIALRHPTVFNRAIGMSGIYDIRQWVDGYYDETIYFNNPIDYIRGARDPHHIERLRRVDTIIAVGREDANIENNRAFSQALWDKDIWHAFRVWEGWAHDWPYWHEMILHYIRGPDSR
jgi:esterase/lipase superfamily enzyme